MDWIINETYLGVKGVGVIWANFEKYIGTSGRGISTFQNGTYARFSKIGKMTNPSPKPKRKVPKYFSKFAQMTPTPSLQGTTAENVTGVADRNCKMTERNENVL